MRVTLIFGVLALTGLVFFTAIQSLPVEAARTVPAAAKALEQAKHDEIAAENAKLREAMSKLDGEKSELASALELTRAETAKLEADLADFEAGKAQMTKLVSENSELMQSLEALQSELSAARQETASLAEDAAAKSAEALQARAEVEQLQASIAEADAAKSTEASQAQSEIAMLKATIAELEQTAGAASKKVAELEMALTEQAGSQNQALQSIIEERDAELAAMADLKKEAEEQTRNALAMTEDLKAMETQLASLQSDIADRDNTIADLNASSQTVSPAVLCQQRSDALMAGKSINFATGTTSISIETIILLSELADIAAACAQENVMLEIEGHTDSTGGPASNLLLSNGRAKAIQAFLAENGVPAASMRAFGFGDSEPVADNATANGRKLNRRIVFDWEQQ